MDQYNIVLYIYIHYNTPLDLDSALSSTEESTSRRIDPFRGYKAISHQYSSC